MNARSGSPTPSLEPKVFGIGLSKTGTTTLGTCFEILGMVPSAHPQAIHDALVGSGPNAGMLDCWAETASMSSPNPDGITGKARFGLWPHRALVAEVLAYRNYDLVIELARHYRSFEDRPWNIAPLYRLLDEAFPGSRFILTSRSADSWWRSVEQWLTRTHPQDEGKRWRYFRQLGVDRIERHAFIAAYSRHNTEIRHYFSGRSDFLEIDFEQGIGWEQLCDFLGCEIPSVPIPHENRQFYV